METYEKTKSPLLFFSGYFRRNNYGILVLSVIISLISIPTYDLTFSTGVDGSLPWIYNYFADGHLSQSKHLIFPHGPFAFLMYPLPVANNVLVAILVFFICSLLFCLNTFKISRLTEQNGYVLPAALLILILAVVDIQLLLITLVSSFVILFHITGKSRCLFSAIFFAAFSLFIKSYVGIICLLLLSGEGVYLLLAKKQVNKMLQIPILFFLFFLSIWCIIYGHPSGSIDFLRGQCELSLNNSEAAAFNTENNWSLIITGFLSLFVIPFISKDRLTRYFFGLMILPLFAAWKHAMARSDEAHIAGLFNFIVVTILLLLLINKGQKTTVVILGLISICSFSLNLGLISPSKQKNIGLFKVNNLYEQIFNIRDLSAIKNKVSRQNISGKLLPDTILKMIRKNTVDIFPCDYSIVAANNLNWAPRPVIQSYAAYNSWLDQKNADHVNSADAAQFVIWEINNLDENGLTLKSIDDRYLLNDEPKTIINFFSHYGLKFKNKNYLVYEKLSAPQKINTKTATAQKKVFYDTWIDVPGLHTNSITRAKVKIKKNLRGNLKSFVYKGESFFICYELENKKIYVNKIVPGNAVDGLWLNPVVMNIISNSAEPRVKRIKIICEDRRMVQKDFDLSFEEIQFAQSATQNQTLQGFEGFVFDKKLPPIEKNLFSGLDNPGKVSGEKGWSRFAGLRLRQDEQTKRIYYELDPDEFSNNYEFQIDMTGLEDTENINFYISAKIKAKEYQKIFLIITQKNQNATPVWWCGKIDNFMQRGNDWIDVTFAKRVPINQLNFNSPFIFYVWNADGKNKAGVSDFFVRVDAVNY